MRFTIAGNLADTQTPALVTWADGALSGSDGMPERVREFVRNNAPASYGPVGGPYSRDALGNGMAAFHLITSLFDPLTVMVTGDVPQAPEVPADALA